jgi:hypothetical protein
MPDATAGRRSRIVLACTLAVFVVHALNYLYFFVDDEGIPLVFARHLLDGRGFVYNSFEGRAEGYSDFLHVFVSAFWLLISRQLSLSPLAPFFFGKALSFACGVGVVWITWRALGRDPAVTTPGRLTAAAFLALAPPLALWSCSSLEMAATTLLVAVLAVGSLEGGGRRDGWAATAACALVLLRIDGIVYAVAILGPAWVAAPPPRRREIGRRLLFPLAITFAAYHAWRWWYFGHLLSCPIATKILYKLQPTENVVTREPASSYGWSFVQMYGIAPAAATIAFVVWRTRRIRRAWPLVASASMLAAYAALVGDWMIGFRFFLPLLPVTSLLIALAVSSLAPPGRAWAVAAAAGVWFAVVAVTSAVDYERMPSHAGWWRAPSLSAARYFSRYLRVYEDLRRIVPPRSRIAYNQAGLVPYLLDADNVDDLGVCSCFVARMPTRDVIFTETGRYSPLTNATALRAANAYLLYRSPDVVVAPLDTLRSANSGAVPDQILRGHYVERLVDRHADAAVYVRTAAPHTAFQTPQVFLENLAHPSRLLRAFDGGVVPPEQHLSRLPFLAEGRLDRSFSGAVTYDLVFAASDLPVFELDVAGVWARTDVLMTLTLRGVGGVVVHREERALTGGRPTAVAVAWPEGRRAAWLTLQLESRGGGPTRVMLRDLRVQGQSPELAAFVRQQLFPSAAETARATPSVPALRH